LPEDVKKGIETQMKEANFEKLEKDLNEAMLKLSQLK